MSRRHRRMRRGGGGSDSLDLLLGPMCNTFGGIVLTAVVLALLSREVDLDSATASGHKLQASAAADATELLQRRLSKAEEDLARAHAFERSLQERAHNPDLAERLRLAAEQLRLRAQLDAYGSNPGGEIPAAASKNSRVSADPGIVAAELKRQLDEILRGALEQSNAREALDENLERMRQSQADLAAQLQREKEGTVKKLRLPKEQPKTKEPYFVVIRYGLLYPRFFFRNGQTAENDTTIETTHGDDEILLEPRPGLGLDPKRDPHAVDTLIAAIPADRHYIDFIVYEDSFDSFEAVKEQTTRAGLNYG